MMALGEVADIKAWYRFLEEDCELRIGQDWCWAWYDNAWAVEFLDPKVEIMVRLKMSDDS